MNNDRYLPALLRDAQLVAAVAVTTEVCRGAQMAHGLAATSTVALGRLLTATVLVGLGQKKPGVTSLQVMCEGRLRQLFAEVTDRGHLRGYVKLKDLDLPQMAEGGARRRRSVSLGVGEGLLAVTREPPGEHFTQSTTSLVSGEIDEDVEHFLNVSDQIPSILACDVVLDRHHQLVQSAGIVVQALPDADEARLQQFRRWTEEGALTELLRAGELDAHQLLRAALPEAEPIDEEKALYWRCRCSYQRVLGALQLLDLQDLAEMIDQREPAIVDCDFCGEHYEVPTEEIEQLLKSAAREKV